MLSKKCRKSAKYKMPAIQSELVRQPKHVAMDLKVLLRRAP